MNEKFRFIARVKKRPKSEKEKAEKKIEKDND